MTTRQSNEPPQRDPRFDAAWRAASSEEPPSALDAAILAAAHREVGAKPQSLSAQAAMRARRRWWPLAAAATVAVIAIGIVQRAEHDEIVAPPSGNAVVSGTPAAPAQSVAESKERAPETPTDSVAPQDSGAALSASPTDEQRRAAPSATAPLRKKAEPAASASAPTEKKSEAVANTPAPLPEPFPATRMQLDAAAAHDAAAGAPPPTDAGSVRSTAPAPQVAPQMRAQVSSQPQSQQVAAPSAPIADIAPESPALQRNEGGAAAKPAAPSIPSSAAPMPMPPGASLAEIPRSSATSAARPSARNAAAGTQEETQIKDRAPLPVADWIALIRRLRDDGSITAAARELAAFRTAHADHEKLLPPDLRDWHPTEK
jgi:hypothetical protein